MLLGLFCIRFSYLLQTLEKCDFIFSLTQVVLAWRAQRDVATGLFDSSVYYTQGGGFALSLILLNVSLGSCESEFCVRFGSTGDGTLVYRFGRRRSINLTTGRFYPQY